MQRAWIHTNELSQERFASQQLYMLWIYCTYRYTDKVFWKRGGSESGNSLLCIKRQCELASMTFRGKTEKQDKRTQEHEVQSREHCLTHLLSYFLSVALSQIKHDKSFVVCAFQKCPTYRIMFILNVTYQFNSTTTQTRAVRFSGQFKDVLGKELKSSCVPINE